MATSSESLIEKFALMLENGAQLGDQEFAEQAIEILVTLSMDPSLSTTLEKINAKIRSILTQSEEMKSQGKGSIAAADQMRELKRNTERKFSELLH